MTTTEKPERVAAAPLSRVLQNSTLYLLGNVASRALGFVAIPFYSHFLSPAEYGIIELIELSTQVVAISFGLQTIGTALVRLYHDQNTVRHEAEVVSTTVIGTAILSGIIVLLGVLLAVPISLAVFHSAEHAGLLQASFVAMWFSSMVEIILVYQRILERARFFFFYSMISLAVTLGLNIYFIGYAGAGVWGFVYSKLVVSGIGTVFLLWSAMREVGWHWRREYIPKLVHFGAPLCFASLCTFAIHFSDRFFLADAVSLAELGKYALAYKFAFLASILVGDSFGKSWNTTFYRFAKQDGWSVLPGSHNIFSLRSS
jgi:O-antigen/teichoic acid export membrane protein